MDERVSLSRYTTLGTGGPARWFARPESVGELQELLGWVRDEGVAVETIGLGSNLLVHDDGVDALVLKLAGDLAGVLVGGVCLSRRRRERRVPAPSPGGGPGRVRVPRQSRHVGRRLDERRRIGREWRASLLDAVIVDAEGERTLTPAEARPLLPALRAGRASGGGSVPPQPRDPAG
jgi:hypothetical protein